MGSSRAEPLSICSIIVIEVALAQRQKGGNPGCRSIKLANELWVLTAYRAPLHSRKILKIRSPPEHEQPTEK
jgi:hypothetical protein